jgi:hypothetical protein
VLLSMDGERRPRFKRRYLQMTLGERGARP